MDSWHGMISLVNYERGMYMKLNFKNHKAAQDMITLIEKDKSLSASDAIKFSINQDIHDKILNTGWASIALGLWGHDDPDREWNKMKNPYIEVEIEENKLKLVNDIAKKEKVDIVTAVSYFLIFTMDSLHYHI